MKSFLRRHYILLLSTLFGVGAFLLSYNLLTGYIALRPVVVAACDLAEYAPIMAKDLKVVDLPKASVVRDSISNLEDAVGKVPLTMIFKGQIVDGRALAGETGQGPLSVQIPQGERGMFLPLSLQGMDQVLQEGTWVDIISSPKRAAQDFFDERYSRILPEVKILKVITDKSSKNIIGVVVAATPQECLWLAEHLGEGALHLAVISARETVRETFEGAFNGR